MRTHFETERKPGNRRAILRLRLARGPLTCDACQVDLAKLYGKDHASVVELHHVQPLSRGVQRPTGTDAFALLCPTCHRVVHYRREDPLTLEEVRRLLKPCAQDPGPR
jgi:5-methylcytosine-specific restriction protein A